VGLVEHLVGGEISQGIKLSALEVKNEFGSVVNKLDRQ
jgi:hypothetical protein